MVAFDVDLLLGCPISLSLRGSTYVGTWVDLNGRRSLTRVGTMKTASRSQHCERVGFIVLAVSVLKFFFLVDTLS